MQLRRIYPRHRVHESVWVVESFEPWLGCVEAKIAEALLKEMFSAIPPEWRDLEALGKKMAEQILQKRKSVRDLMISA
jgi:hypothetical protein